MVNRIIFIGLASILVLGAVTYGIWHINSREVTHVCTLEAKICPDGSAVGRTGPNCEFAPCPIATTTPVHQKPHGTLSGTVTLSPTCPVERIPPDPRCAPKPYAAILDISASGFFAQIHADMNGAFLINLAPGTYTIITNQTSLYPRCESKQVTVTADATTTADISCDTGIR